MARWSTRGRAAVAWLPGPATAGPAALRAALAVIAGAAIATGCGDDAPAGGTTAPAATAPASPSAPIVIERPADGSRVRARQTPAGRLRAHLQVRGSTRPHSPVFLSASCRPLRCEARATGDSDGAWAVAMTLSTTGTAHFVTIDASSQARVSAASSAVTTVELVAPGPAAGASGASDSSSRATNPPPPPPPPPPAAARLPALAHDVLVIGDSLAEGTADPLRSALSGWRVRTDAKISRPLRVGMGILAAEPDPPAILAFSLFTNDDPSATAALERAVRATASRPGGCAVWATIVRPPYNGVSYDAANRVLERLANDPNLRLRLVPWAEAVARSPSFVAGDGVHATPDGYRARAALYAQAIRSCAGGS